VKARKKISDGGPRILRLTIPKSGITAFVNIAKNVDTETPSKIYFICSWNIPLLLLYFLKSLLKAKYPYKKK